MNLRRREVWEHDKTMWAALGRGDPCTGCCDETDAEYEYENMKNCGWKKLELGNSRPWDLEFH